MLMESSSEETGNRPQSAERVRVYCHHLSLASFSTLNSSPTGSSQRISSYSVHSRINGPDFFKKIKAFTSCSSCFILCAETGNSDRLLLSSIQAGIKKLVCVCVCACEFPLTSPYWSPIAGWALIGSPPCDRSQQSAVNTPAVDNQVSRQRTYVTLLTKMWAVGNSDLRLKILNRCQFIDLNRKSLFLFEPDFWFLITFYWSKDILEIFIGVLNVMK